MTMLHAHANDTAYFKWEDKTYELPVLDYGVSKFKAITPFIERKLL